MQEHLVLAQSLITTEQQRFLKQQKLTLEDFLRGGMLGIWQDREQAYRSIFQDWNEKLGQRTFVRTWEMLHSEEQEKLLITHVLRWSILRDEDEEVEHYPSAFYSTYYQHHCWLVCRSDEEEAQQFHPLYEMNDAQEVLALFDQATITIDRGNEGEPTSRYSVTLFRAEKQAMAQGRFLSEAVVIAALRFEQIIDDTGIVLVD